MAAVLGRAEQITGPPVKVSVINLVRSGYTVAADGAINQQLDVSVQWDRPSMAKWYDVYFDTVNPPVTRVSDDQVATVYVPTLALDGTYYLRINAANALGETAGDVVTFSTWASADIAMSDDGITPATDEEGNYVESPDV